MAIIYSVSELAELNHLRSYLYFRHRLMGLSMYYSSRYAASFARSFPIPSFCNPHYLFFATSHRLSLNRLFLLCR